VAVSRTRRARVAALSLLTAVTLGVTSCSNGTFIGGSDEVNTIGAGVSAELDSAIEAAMQLSASSAAVVGVWSASGEYVHAYGDGLDASASIRAAQASQPVMCALLLDLVAQGTLDLDREVSEDLPRQVRIEGITYRQLCDGTSGIAGFLSPALIDVFTNNPTRAWSDRELFAHSLAHSPLAAPGTEVHPSDGAPLLLARALSQLTKTSINSLLQDHVFGPSEMRASRFPSDLAADTTLPKGGMTGVTYPSAGGLPVCTAVEPTEDGEEGETETVTLEATPVAEVSPSMLGTAGATVSTVTDLKRFYERYLAGGFGADGSASLVTSLTVPPPPAPEEGEEGETAEPPANEPAEDGKEGEDVEPVTDGWTFGLEKHSSLFGMSGTITGTSTAAYHDPASGFTVVVAVNNSSAGTAFVQALAFQLAAIAGANVDWSEEDQAAVLAELAVCQPEATEESEE